MERVLTCLPGEQVFGLEGGDVGDRGEDVCAVNDRSLDAVTLIDASVASFFVQYELHRRSHHITVARYRTLSQSSKHLCIFGLYGAMCFF